MGLWAAIYSGPQPPTLKLLKKFVNRNRNLVSTDLALVHKVISPELNKSPKNHTTTYIKMLKSDAHSILCLTTGTKENVKESKRLSET